MRGNKWFSAGNYKKALEYYEIALNHCPSDCTKDMSVFHQNISAAYERLAHHPDVAEEDMKQYCLAVIQHCSQGNQL